MATRPTWLVLYFHRQCCAKPLGLRVWSPGQQQQHHHHQLLEMQILGPGSKPWESETWGWCDEGGAQTGGWSIGCSLHFNKPSKDSHAPHEFKSHCSSHNTVSTFEDEIRLPVILESFRFHPPPRHLCGSERNFLVTLICELFKRFPFVSFPVQVLSSLNISESIIEKYLLNISK